MALHSKTSFYSQRSSTEPPAFNTMINSLAAPTRDLTALAREERHFTFSHFTCEHAWVIGNILRNALRTADCACLIDISLPALTLFHAPSMPGVMPDSELWVQKKKNTVLRWGHSTWYMGCAFDWDYKRFAEYHAMSGDEWAKYTRFRSDTGSPVAESWSRFSMVREQGEEGEEGSMGVGAACGLHPWLSVT